MRKLLSQWLGARNKLKQVGIDWNFSGLSQKFSEFFHIFVKEISWDFLSTFSRLSQSFSGYSKDFSRTFSRFSLDFSRTFTGPSQDFLRTFSGILELAQIGWSVFCSVIYMYVKDIVHQRTKSRVWLGARSGIWGNWYPKTKSWELLVARSGI